MQLIFCQNAVNQSSVALRRTLQSQDGTSGKPISLPMLIIRLALRSIGMAFFGLKPGCHDLDASAKVFEICVETTVVVDTLGPARV